MLNQRHTNLLHLQSARIYGLEKLLVAVYLNPKLSLTRKLTEILQNEWWLHLKALLILPVFLCKSARLLGISL